MKHPAPPPRQRGLPTTERGGIALRHINQSELTTFTRCRRKWQYGYHEGFKKPSYESNLETGSAVHSALQAYYQNQDPFAALKAYWAPVVEAIADRDVPVVVQVMKDINLSNIMIEGYLQWAEEEAVDAGLTVVAIEEKVEILLRPDVTLHGTMDLVMADPDGNLHLIDHKTTAAFGILTDRRMQLNFQLLTYAVLCEEFFGKAPAGAYLNMLRKVQRTAAAKPPFYQREPVHFNRHQLTAHRKHMDAILTDLLRIEDEIALGDDSSCYPVVDQDCSWKCPFLSVCAFADDGSDIEGALNDLYVRSDRKVRT